MSPTCPEAQFSRLSYDEKRAKYFADVCLTYDDADNVHKSVHFACTAPLPKDTPLAAVQVALLHHAERQCRFMPEYQSITKDLSDNAIVVP